MEERRMMGVAQFDYLSFEQAQKFLLDWVYLTRILFQPKKMIIEGKKQHFDHKHLSERIQNLGKAEDLWVMVENDEEEASLHLANGTIFERLLLDEETYQKFESLIEDYLTKRLMSNGILAYFRAYEEYLYHNIVSLSERRAFESAKEQEQLPKMKDPHGGVIVDCSKLPGYDLFYQGSLFTSCWRMFFGKDYHLLIPKKIFLDVQQVEQVKKVGKGVFIEIYKDPYQWREPANLEYQQLFRDQLGMDHFVDLNGVGRLREPFIEYAYIGSVVQTVQYQNDQLQPTGKSHATHFLTRTYDFLNKQYHERQMKGVLNAQAYFPWVDDVRKKMMNYKILQPDLTLDEGISAYKYYLREYLEVPVEDEHYQNYTAILRIYVPRHNLEELPIEKIMDAMPDIDFKKVHHRKDKVFFELTKDNKHLKVVFLNLETLDVFDENELLGL